MKPEIEKRLERAQSLPTIPGVAQRIVELGQQAEVDTTEVSEVLSRDPALTAKILRAANSPIFAHRRKASSLREAIMALGLEATLTLALGFVLVRNLNSVSGRLDYHAFWRRAMVSGAAAQSISERIGRLNSEEVLLAGMLQDIGMLVFDALMPREYGRLAAEAEDHESLRLAEKNILEVDHAELGLWLMQRWNLPEYLQCAAFASHEPELMDLPENEGNLCQQKELGKIVALSSRMADIWVTRDSDSATMQAASLAYEFYGWDQEAFGEVLSKVAELVRHLTDVYEIENTSVEDLAAISDQARETLTLRSLHMIHEAAQERRRNQELEAQNSILKDQAEKDALTELYNRRHLEKRLKQAFAQARKHNKTMALALIDLDYFKRVNDELGHQAGDAVLYGVAQVLRQQVRDDDILARYGGEEFLLALPDVGELAAKGIMQRIRKAIAETEYSPGAGAPARRITTSIGYAISDGSDSRLDSVEALIEAADKALYRAKVGGRNRVELFGPEVH
ncbi:diguanylate cyclase/phosphodiesterase with PAS/PAC sensor [Halorhodospira halochloris]|uniref:diguanylate cyclase n=1 Tax=Halorhodospira halochloris TaxID=1052 RepID=A0A110B4X2_HALHR|nr:GGDEF domain-containing protein [Halorhodospira halochloris]MBK1651120.1 hypothetical protein [Halorhodospira halochloris]BAU57387.2 diguanylate cyclase/phosphodiesterase with PAS/PAC sensor [Halorhodospira halochloris]